MASCVEVGDRRAKHVRNKSDSRSQDRDSGKDDAGEDQGILNSRYTRLITEEAFDRFHSRGLDARSARDERPYHLAAYSHLRLK